MQKPQCPLCFGDSKRFDYENQKCKSCVYIESCNYIIKDDDKLKGKANHVSYEHYSYSQAVSTKACQIKDDLDTGDNFENADLKEVLEFLLDVDNYTAELVHEVLRGNCNTASDLAKKFGISRQAIHRKLIDACTLHPQFRQLFISRLYRCRRVLSDSERIQKIKNHNKKNIDQLTFNFNE